MSTLLAKNVSQPSTCASMPTTSSIKSYSAAVKTGVALVQPSLSESSIQEEVAEVVERERRKGNIVILNLSSSVTTHDSDKVVTLDRDNVKKLIESLVDDAEPAFNCTRLGNGVNKPLLVK